MTTTEVGTLLGNNDHEKTTPPFEIAGVYKPSVGGSVLTETNDPGTTTGSVQVLGI